MSRFNNIYPDKVDAQGYLAQDFRKAQAILEERYKKLEVEVIESFMKMSGLTEACKKLELRFLDEAGVEVTLRPSLDYKTPDPKSKLGKALHQILGPLDELKEKLYEIHREGSLRVSLGKGADEKLAVLKDIGKQMAALVAHLK